MVEVRSYSLMLGRASADTERKALGNSLRGVRQAQIIAIVLEPLTHLQDVAIALGREQAGTCPAKREEGAGRHRRAGLDDHAGFLGLEDAHAAVALAQFVMMRLAVAAAGNAARAVARPVAGRVRDSRLLDARHESEIDAVAAAMCARAARTDAKFVMREMLGKSHFRDLDAGELDAAGRMPFAGVGPAIASRRRAAARAGVEEMPDEAAVRARILALDRDAEASRPAGHCAVGAGRREGDDDRLDDLLRAVARRQRDRRAFSRPHDRALARDHLHRPREQGPQHHCVVRWLVRWVRYTSARL